MKTMILAILICSALAGVSSGSEQPGQTTFDFSALDIFWEIVAELEQDRQPSQASWDALFSTPGYAALTASEFTREFFVDAFSAVFMPGKAAELDALIRSDARRSRYYEHMIKVKQNLETARSLQKKFTDSPALMTRALAKTSALLSPEQMAGGIPPVAFVIFGNDARGYTPIVVDLLFADEQEESFIYLLAHEAFHFYRNGIVTLKTPEEGSPDASLMWIIDQIQNEGIADMIDKAEVFYGDGETASSRWAKRYRDYVADSPLVIAKLDSLFATYAGDPGQRENTAAEIVSLIPMSGHPTGYHMANVILGQSGRDAMLEDIGNPIAFLRRYHVAAVKAGSDHSAFSTETLDLLDELEAKYGGDHSETGRE